MKGKQMRVPIKKTIVSQKTRDKVIQNNKKVAYFREHKKVVAYTDVCDKCKQHHKYLIDYKNNTLCEYCFMDKVNEECRV